MITSTTLAATESRGGSADSAVEKLALELARDVALSMGVSEPLDPQEKLDSLAILVSNLPGIQGALLVAHDDSLELLATGSHALSISPEHLRRCCALAHGRNTGAHNRSFWSPTPLQPNQYCQDGTIRMLPLSQSGNQIGLLIIRPERSSQDQIRSAMMALEEVQEICAWALKEILRDEVFGRLEKLQALTVEVLSNTRLQSGIPFQELTQRLKELFRAEAVTILLQDGNNLCLTSSTDPELQNGEPVIVKPGQSLAGWIFEQGIPLRLKDINDKDDIYEKTGMKSISIDHHAFSDGHLSSGQFLGVPMRHGHNAQGVLHISRRAEMLRFTGSDEHALQFGADLLGTFVALAWDLTVAKSTMSSTSEAIAISRMEPGPQRRATPRIIWANRGAEQLLGRQANELYGSDARKLYAPGAYQKIHEKLQVAFTRAKETGLSELDPIDSQIRRPDGSFRSVKISYRILANRFVHPPSFFTIGVARDTTEIETKADQHRRLLEMLGDKGLAYFRVDSEGKTLESTKAEEAITGYSLDELQTFLRTELYDNPLKRARFLSKARQADGQLIRGKHLLRRKNGDVFWAEGDLRLLRDLAGKEIGFEGLYQDITDRLQLQNFVDADNERLLMDDELFEKLKENARFHLDYLTSLGHQLQTPLSSLIENLRNFEQGRLGPAALGERLPYIIGQAIVCTRLVRNFSYMDKILRHEPFSPKVVALAKLAIETKLEFKHLLREKDKRLNLEVADQSLNWSPPVFGHREMLRQVVVNLVDNAIKYSAPGSWIRIRGLPKSRALEISNEGLIVPEQHRKEIFKRGFRTRAAQMRVPHGTGLGLWLVRKIVEAHEARIEYREEKEKGKRRVVFRITFPHRQKNHRRST